MNKRKNTLIPKKISEACHTLLNYIKASNSLDFKKRLI